MIRWPELVKGRAPVIVLAGAAHGQNVERYRGRWPWASYVLFEPNPAYHRLLARFARDPLVTFEPKALAAERGRATFYQNAEPQTSSLYPANAEDGWGWRLNPAGELQVVCETLDGFCADHRVDRVGFLELDAQGGELNALRGAADLLKRRRIDVLMVEVFYTEVYRGVPLAGEVDAFMRSAGYASAGEVPARRQIGVARHWGDVIYCPAPALARATTAKPAARAGRGGHG